MPDLGRGFSPARADCGYRAPLAPRLARPCSMVASGPPLIIEAWTAPKANNRAAERAVVTPSDSMDALREAASRRNAHELEAHGYTHVVTTTLGPSTFAQGPSARRRGRRRREEELNVI